MARRELWAWRDGRQRLRTDPLRCVATEEKAPSRMSDVVDKIAGEPARNAGTYLRGASVAWRPSMLLGLAVSGGVGNGVNSGTCTLRESGLRSLPRLGLYVLAAWRRNEINIGGWETGSESDRYIGRTRVECLLHRCSKRTKRPIDARPYIQVQVDWK